MSSTTSSLAMARRVREAIRAAGRSQRQIAVEAAIDETKLSKSLSGQRRFTRQELVDLARCTGVTVGRLLGEEGDDTSVSVTPPQLETAGATPASPDQARRHREIVEAAWRLFAGKGFDAVRVSDVAAAAGVSSATVHYYFPGKPDLFAATLMYSVKLAHSRQIARLTAVDDPVARLWQLLDMQSPHGEIGRLEWSIWLQSWNRVALAQGIDEEYLEIYRRWSETVRAAIADGQELGAIQPGSSEAMAQELTALVDGLGTQVLTGVLDDETMARRIGEYVQRRLLVPGVELTIERPVPSSEGSPPDRATA
ncbi:TetR/AcrR family transcriptional regulator [Nesterenkonia halophila]|uniref:TetR/AcrR family transcriptional regulator n=1 Tax=Nesterenkonia halophila TaxID=302044 RepID=UPI0012910F07|nr:TetR/AcrR family transcriptional regulator [Nesterenkonia halophila]